MVQILQENLMTQTEFIFKVNLTMNWSPQQGGGGAPPTLGTTRLSFGAMTTKLFLIAFQNIIYNL